jgi:tRNA (guanine37-N1)-methyltransferase
MVLMDAVTRLIPGVLGGEGSAADDSFGDGLLEHAQFTRPPKFEDESPPPVLLSGDHQAIAEWRLESALIRTFLKRRDLLEKRDLNREEVEILKKWSKYIEKIIRE